MKHIVLALLILAGQVAAADIGFGFNWGFDWSVRNDTQTPQPVDIDILLTTEDYDVIHFPSSDKPMSVTANNMEPAPLNFGFKFSVASILPVELETAVNFGFWEYEGQFHFQGEYEDSNGDRAELDTVVNLYLEDDGFAGLTKTPYGKLSADITAKRSLDILPVFKPYGGAGFSLNWSTPLLSAEFVQEALGDTARADENNDTVIEDELDKVVELMRDNILGEFSMGMHILAGFNLKIPAAPVQFFCDGKYAIPFKRLNENLIVHGVRVHTGVMFIF